MSESPVSPEIAVLTRQVALLETEREQLRRSLVQQFNASSKVMRLLLSVDQDRFAGRFQNITTEDGLTPVQELQVGEQVINALLLELNNAEKSRNEAESALSRHLDEHAAGRIATGIADALQNNTHDLENLRRQALADQESAANELRQVRQDAHGQLIRARDEMVALRGHIAQLEEFLSREKDQRAADRAEVFSLAAEILRVAATDPSLADDPDISIPLAALEDSLNARLSVDAVASAAESVLAAWARLATIRNQASQQVMSQDSQTVAKDVVEVRILAETCKAEAEAERRLRQDAEAAEAVRAAQAKVQEAALLAALLAARSQVRNEFSGLLLAARTAIRDAQQQQHAAPAMAAAAKA